LLDRTYYKEKEKYRNVAKWLRHSSTNIQAVVDKPTCITCGVEISSRNLKYCIKCAGAIRRKAERPSPIQLKELIRLQPFTTIAAQFGVSDNAIRKWCKLYNLPSTKREINSYSDNEWKNIGT
jgi:hypothetical protein